MSLRKDNHKEKDNFYMNLALKLAKDRVGLTGINPSVGCVIVKDNEIISIGQKLHLMVVHMLNLMQ